MKWARGGSQNLVFKITGKMISLIFELRCLTPLSQKPSSVKLFFFIISFMYLKKLDFNNL